MELTKPRPNRRTAPKSERIEFRVNADLKERYIQALEREDISATDHLTQAVFEFIQASEKRKAQ